MGGRERGAYFKELPHVMEEAGKSRVCRGQQAGDPESLFPCELLAEHCPLHGKEVSLGPLTDWMRPTHNMEGNAFYSKSWI